MIDMIIDIYVFGFLIAGVFACIGVLMRRKTLRNENTILIFLAMLWLSIGSWYSVFKFIKNSFWSPQK